eukprot:scaffold85992_cov63-Phaeocystis_antarctica.AAC.9
MKSGSTARGVPPPRGVPLPRGVVPSAPRGVPPRGVPPRGVPPRGVAPRGVVPPARGECSGSGTGCPMTMGPRLGSSPMMRAPGHAPAQGHAPGQLGSPYPYSAGYGCALGYGCASHGPPKAGHTGQPAASNCSASAWSG